MAKKQKITKIRYPGSPIAELVKVETVVIESFDSYDFDGKIEDVIKRLEFYHAEQS